MSSDRKWSINDARFLRSLRIVADAPPPPSLRFVVEPGAVDGTFDVVDRQRRFHTHSFAPKEFKQPRAAAEAFATQMNTKHGEEKPR